MFVSRILTSIVFKTTSRRFLSSVTSTEKTIVSEDKPEWLWSYLRNRIGFSELTDEQKRRVIEIEVQTFRESGERMPLVIPDDRWSELINSTTLESRKSLYEYLFLREMYRKRRAEKVAANTLRRIEAGKRREELLAAGKPPTNYPGYSSIFRHLGRPTEKYLREQRILSSARLNERIVIDCSFEEEHTRQHYVLNLIDQVQYIFAEVERFHSPSFVYLCNLSPTGRLQAEFNRRAPLESLCVEATPSSYLDLFPKEKLIYLSPDSNVEMTEFDHDAIYIIGGIIDVGGKKPLTINKAKRENIRHQRFPIDRYVKFGGGSGKTLTLDQVYNILMTLKHTGSWVEAFKYIPDRKIIERYAEKLQEKKSEYEQYGQWTRLNTKV